MKRLIEHIRTRRAVKAQLRRLDRMFKIVYEDRGDPRG